MRANVEARKLETLDSIIHRAASHLSLGAGVLVAAYALVDSFVVDPGDRVFYLGMRAVIASLFLGHSWLIKRLTPSPYSFLHGYVSYALYIALFFTAVVRAGIFPSPYYGAPMLMIGSLALMPWRALHAWIICALLIVLWTALNFWQGIEPVMAVHLKYLVGLSGVTIYASKCRHEAIVQLNKQGHELAGAVQKLSDVARQTAHDIRSPIAALRVVCQAGQEIPELHRLLVRDATDRINDIANNLITHHGAGEKAQAKVDDVLVSPVVHSVLSEKRACHRGAPVTFQLAESTESAAAFARVDGSMLHRLVSNLLNNAVEAMPKGGQVTVSLALHADWLLLEVRDQGCGIAQHDIPRVLRGGVSVGKDGGQGLGLSSSLRLAKEWGGDLELESQVGVGTTVRVVLPSSRRPEWFCHQLKVPASGAVLALDDDASMGHLWKERFETLCQDGHVALQVFREADAFQPAVRRAPADALCLVDYELLNSRLTGLDVVAQLAAWPRTVLVTSRYDSVPVMAAASQHALKVLPKAFASRVAIALAAGAVAETGARRRAAG